MNNDQNRQNTLDFIQGIIDRIYENAEFDKNKGISYNQGIQFAAIKGLEETFYEKTVKELQKQ